MGWTVNTYAGTRATGQPSNYRLCMYDLIHAIEQRQRLRYPNGYRPYLFPPYYETLPFFQQWWNGDNSFVSDVGLDDLYMLRCTGTKGFQDPYSNSSKNSAYKNMALITQRLLALLDGNSQEFPGGLSWIIGAPSGFVTEPGGDTLYTKETLEDAIGNEIKYPERVNEARWWQSIQDALDKLIYLRTVMSPIELFGQYNTSNPKFYNDIFGPTRAGAFEKSWDERSDNTANLSLAAIGGFGAVGISVGYGVTAVTSSTAQSCLAAYSTYPTSFLYGCGDVLSAKIAYNKRWEGIGRYGWGTPVIRASSPVSATINGTTVTSTADQSDTNIYYSDISVSDGYANTPVNLLVSGDPPDSNPFIFSESVMSGIIGAVGRAGNTGITIGQMLVYTDASSVLDDQN